MAWYGYCLLEAYPSSRSQGTPFPGTGGRPEERHGEDVMKRSVLIAAVVICLLGAIAGRCSLYLYEEEYAGRIVDAGTGDPVPGAVVLAVWYAAFPLVRGPFYLYEDAMETTTDAAGRFAIPGRGLQFFSRLRPVHVTVFKPACECLKFQWDQLEGGYGLSRNIHWEGAVPVIPLRNLAAAEWRGKERLELPSRVFPQDASLILEEGD